MQNQERKKIDWVLLLLSITLTISLCYTFILIQGKIDHEDLAPHLTMVNAVIPDLIAALIVVIVIFIFLKVRGIDRNEQLKKELIQGVVDEITKQVSSSNINKLAYQINYLQGKKFITYKEANNIFDFSSKISHSKEIWINGYSCLGIITNNRKELSDAVINGATVKLLITKTDSKAAEIMGKRTKTPNIIVSDVNRVLDLLNISQEEISQSQKKNKGILEVKFTSWIPSCSMIFCNPNQKSGECKVTIYPPFHSTSKSSLSANFILYKKKSNEEEYFNYFKSQFQKLWDLDSNE